MTQEAKVGLLLGLVFLVAIAVIFRGVRQNDLGELPQNIVNTVERSGDTEQQIEESVRRLSTQLQSRPDHSEEFETPAGRPVERVTAPPIPTPAVTSPRTRPIAPNPAVAEDVRHVQALPSTQPSSPAPARWPDSDQIAQSSANNQERIEQALRELTESVPLTARRVTMPWDSRSTDSAPAVTTRPTASAPAGLYVVHSGDNLSKIALKVYGAEEGNKRDNVDAIFQANRDILSTPDELRVGQTLRIPQLRSVAVQEEITLPTTPPPSSPAESTGATTNSIYVVQEGDDLSGIALKVYGPTQGRRWVNVQRIFDANRSVLKSSDVLYVGQRLRIPALPSEMAASEPAATARRESTGRVYIVKEGDSLWDIAEEQLGDGMRYTDIDRLNSKVLGPNGQIHPGMQLMLPPQ